MITKEIVKELYRRYPKRVESIDYLNMTALFSGVDEVHGIKIVEQKLEIGSIDERSPFKRLNLRFIHGIESLDNEVAIVLGTSIVFLSKREPEVKVHLPIKKEPFWRRMLQKLKILR